MQDRHPPTSTNIRWSRSGIAKQQKRNAERKEHAAAERRLKRKNERPAKPPRPKAKHHRRKKPLVPYQSAQSMHGPGVVYVVRMHGRYKIGQSGNTDRRIPEVARQLRAKSYHVVRLIETTDRLALERALHREFAAKRIEGEWFDLDADDLALLATMG